MDRRDSLIGQEVRRSSSRRTITPWCCAGGHGWSTCPTNTNIKPGGAGNNFPQQRVVFLGSTPFACHKNGIDIALGQWPFEVLEAIRFRKDEVRDGDNIRVNFSGMAAKEMIIRESDERRVDDNEIGILHGLPFRVVFWHRKGNTPLNALSERHKVPDCSGFDKMPELP